MDSHRICCPAAAAASIAAVCAPLAAAACKLAAAAPWTSALSEAEEFWIPSPTPVREADSAWYDMCPELPAAWQSRVVLARVEGGPVCQPQGAEQCTDGMPRMRVCTWSPS